MQMWVPGDVLMGFQYGYFIVVGGFCLFLLCFYFVCKGKHGIVMIYYFVRASLNCHTWQMQWKSKTCFTFSSSKNLYSCTLLSKYSLSTIYIDKNWKITERTFCVYKISTFLSKLILLHHSDTASEFVFYIRGKIFYCKIR